MNHFTKLRWRGVQERPSIRAGNQFRRMVILLLLAPTSGSEEE